MLPIVVDGRHGRRLGGSLVVFFAKFAHFSSSMRGTGSNVDRRGVRHLRRVRLLISGTRIVLASGRDSLSSFNELLSCA